MEYKEYPCYQIWNTNNNTLHIHTESTQSSISKKILGNRDIQKVLAHSPLHKHEPWQRNIATLYIQQMLCHWYFSKHLEFDKYTNRNPNNYSTIPFLDDNNDPDNATTTDNIDESASSRSDHRDIIFVVLAFLSVTGCFIYLLCKCSNSWYVIPNTYCLQRVPTTLCNQSFPLCLQ